MSIIMYTPWIGDPELEYSIGWFTLSIILLCCLINLSIVLYNFICFLGLLNRLLLAKLNQYLERKERMERNKFCEENREAIELEIDRRRRQQQEDEFQNEMDQKGIDPAMREQIRMARERKSKGIQLNFIEMIPAAPYEDEWDRKNRLKREQLEREKAERENLESKEVQDYFQWRRDL